MTTTARAIKASDGSTDAIEIAHYLSAHSEYVELKFAARWEDLRVFAGELLELIKQAEANADPS